MIKERYKFHVLKLKISDHPIYIRERLLNLSQDQFGFDAFGLKNTINRSFKNYLIGYKQKLI